MTGPAVEVVPTDSTGTVTVTAPLAHLCPYRDETDHGTITLAWSADGATIELHSLREWLGGFASDKVSHEELTSQIARSLESLATRGVYVRDVCTEWATAGMTVQVSAD